MMKGDTVNPDKWAVTLCYDAQEKLEDRAGRTVEYLAKHSHPSQWVISDIEATGRNGGSLTRRLNNEGTLRLSSTDLLDVLREEGQVIELDAVLVKDNQELFRILIRDGVSVDALGTGKFLPLSALGNYHDVDVELFMW
ncbi:hypothetical protein HYR99_08130 [Candidatus Poribacteria bacterium]|nr:hypothetical protein [Candidatus Poribacteria bacterium]